MTTTYETMSDEEIAEGLRVVERGSRATYYEHRDLGHLEQSTMNAWWSTMGSPKFDSLQDLALWIVEKRGRFQ